MLGPAAGWKTQESRCQIDVHTVVRRHMREVVTCGRGSYFIDALTHFSVIGARVHTHLLEEIHSNDAFGVFQRCWILPDYASAATSLATGG